MTGSVDPLATRRDAGPVAVRRPRLAVTEEDAMANTIVVGVDGSAGADVALDWALREAGRRGDRVRVIMAWDYLGQPRRHDGSGFDPDFDTDAARAMLDEIVDEALARLGHDEVDVARTAILDRPARALLEAADGADLLVVGRRGLGGFRGLVLGSVSQAVLAHAPCPVVVLPADSD